MNTDQDIYKMEHSPEYVYWTYLFKSIKDKFTP
jgi:hypothetical protein